MEASHRKLEREQRKADELFADALLDEGLGLSGEGVVVGGGDAATRE